MGAWEVHATCIAACYLYCSISLFHVVCLVNVGTPPSLEVYADGFIAYIATVSCGMARSTTYPHRVSAAM